MYLLENKIDGITLVALVITIVVLLILAGVSINMVLGNNGIINKAQEAKEKMTQATVEEKISLLLSDYQVVSTLNDIDIEDFLKLEATEEIDGFVCLGDGTIEIEKDGYLVTCDAEENIIDICKIGSQPRVRNIKVVANKNGTGEKLEERSVNSGEKVYITFDTLIENGNITVTPAIPFAVSENGTYEFTITGEDSTTGESIIKNLKIKVNQFKFKQGDFIAYDAGTWTEDEISALGTLYAGESISKQSYKFGGFKVGSSKNSTVNASGTNKYTSGWQVLNVEENGTINIVQAGACESYYHPQKTNGAYKSEYILNRNSVNESLTDEIKSEVEITRDWSVYENSDLVVEGSAHCMTTQEAKNCNIRTVGAEYWLATPGTDSSQILTYVSSSGTIVGYWNDSNFWKSRGIRIVLTLKSNFKVSSGDGSQDNPYILKLK